MKQVFAAIAFAVAISSMCYAQQSSSQSPANIKTTSAYGLLVEKKVAVEAELKEVLSKNTSDFPSAKIKQLELNALEDEMKKMRAIAESKIPKLTSGYGMLILRRVALKSEKQALLLEYTSDSPNVKRKEVELNLLEQEIQKILQ